MSRASTRERVSLSFRAELQRTLEDLVPKAKDSLADTVEFARQRAMELSSIVGSPDFDMGAEAARDAIALHGAVNLVEQARISKAAMETVLASMLRIGAAAIAAV